MGVLMYCLGMNLQRCGCCGTSDDEEEDDDEEEEDDDDEEEAPTTGKVEGNIGDISMVMIVSRTFFTAM